MVKLLKNSQDLKIILIFILFFVFNSLFVPRFFDIENLYSIIVQMAPIGIIAVGMTFVILTAGIDLSVGSLVAMISVMMAGSGNYPFSLMLILALVWGFIAGALNGAMISVGKISPFIVTLSSMAIAKGIALWRSNTEERVIQDPSFAFIGSGEFLGIPLPVWIFLFLVIAAQIVLRRTVFGKQVCAVGSNPIAARNAGVNVPMILWIVYTISGVTCALSALVISSRLNISTPTVGEFYELDAIAAVIIGGTYLFGGRGSVIGTLIGVLIFGMITNSLNLLGASPHIQRMTKGGVILFAMLLQSGVLVAFIKKILNDFKSSWSVVGKKKSIKEI